MLYLVIFEIYQGVKIYNLYHCCIFHQFFSVKKSSTKDGCFSNRFFFCILCFVCGSQSRCSRANAEQRLKIVGLVGGGSGSGMQQNSVQLSRDYLFYFTNNKRKTHQKTSLYHNNRKEQQKNIVARLQS